MKKQFSYIMKHKILIGGGLLLLLGACCSCDNNEQEADQSIKQETKQEYDKKLVVVDEPVPSGIKEHAIVMRALKDKKLRVLSYDKNSLSSFLRYGDTVDIDKWYPYTYESFYEKHFFTSDYPMSDKDKGYMWKIDRTVYVEFSDETKEMLWKRQAEHSFTTQEIEISNTMLTKMLAMNSEQRTAYIKNIQDNGTDTQRKCLQYVLESVQYEKDVIDWHAKYEKDIIDWHAKKESLTRQQQMEHESRIIDYKKDGTLGRYLTDTKGSIRDTVTIVKVYKERRKSLDGVASYTSTSNGTSSGGGVVFGGIGGGGVGGASSSNADGSAVLSGSDKIIQTVIAKDQYGYMYTFELDPEMNCKVGDQIVLDYFGRVADATRFFDKVLVQNIIYKSR